MKYILIENGHCPQLGDDIGYASSPQEARELQREFVGAEIRMNEEFSVAALRENYWFPQDWPVDLLSDEIWIIYMPEPN